MAERNGATPPELVRAIEENEAKLAETRRKLNELHEQREQETRSLLDRFEGMSDTERMALYRRDPERWRQAMDAMTERNRTERLGLS